jgi:hypothetical protein
MRFELGKVYGRDDRIFLIVAEVGQTINSGPTVLAEEPSGNICKLCDSHDATVGYNELTWSEYVKHFNFKDECKLNRERQIYIELGPLALKDESEKGLADKEWLEHHTWIQEDGTIDYSRARNRPLMFCDAAASNDQ